MKDIIKKNYIFILLCLVLEVIVITMFKNSDAKLTVIIAIIGIPIGLYIFNYMYKSFENTLLGCVFSIFLLPACGYVLLRMGFLDKQWMFYTAYYLIILVLLIKNGLFKRINRERNTVKNKYIRIILLILLIINIFFAYDKQLSFMVVTISFLPFMLIFYIIKTSFFKDKVMFYDKLLQSAVLGALVSGLPDSLYYIILLFKGEHNRVFGPLGSNAILPYILIMFILTLSKWIKKKGIKNIWTLYIIGFIFILGTQESRGALITIFLVYILYMIFDIKNWIKYSAVFFLVGAMVFSNVIGRSDVLKDINNIVEKKENHISKDENIEGESIKDLSLEVLDSQSKNRQILWKTGIELSRDYKVTGVGISNFKYFYKEYSKSERPYSDAHNLLLNLSSELGIPFMLVSLILMIKLGWDMIMGYFKKNNEYRIKYLAGGISLIAFFIYGNLTGIALNFSNEVYSFSSTFIILFMLFYIDCINEFV